MHRSDTLKGKLFGQSDCDKQKSDLLSLLVRFRKTSRFVLNYLFLSPRMRLVMAGSLKVDFL